MSPLSQGLSLPIRKMGKPPRLSLRIFTICFWLTLSSSEILPPPGHSATLTKISDDLPPPETPPPPGAEEDV